MIGNRFGKAYIDGSFLITRNLWVATKDKEIADMNPGEVVKITLQTLNKLASTWGITCDKLCLIFDEWDKNLGGYIRSWMIRDYVQYKGSRKFMTQKLLDEMKQDPNIPAEEITKAERELAINKVKFEAKKIMKEEFKRIGIPYFSYPGYEFDDIATLAAFQNYGKTDKPDIIVTKDTDLTYSLTPSNLGTSFFSLPTKGSEPKIITYEEMYNTIPQVLRDRNIGLYWYHAYCDSLGIAGHNDNLKTIKSGRDGVQAILNIMNGNFEDVENIDAFKAQMNSFDLSNFPDLDKVQQMISNDFNTAGHIGSVKEFREFCQKNNITGISDTYYMGMIGRFDSKLFSEV